MGFRRANSEVHNTEVFMNDSVFYINWHDPNEVCHIRLSQEEYNQKFQWFKNHGHLINNRNGEGNRTRRLSWIKPFSYCVEQDHQQVNLYTSDDKFNFTVYYTLCDSSKCSREDGVSGGSAFRLVDRMFNERFDISLQAAFGRCENDFIFDSVNMALAPIIYTNERDCDYTLTNIFKADVSSAYPYGLTFDLPDYHKRSVKKLAGIYPPTEEYPFAFYIKSGHMAIYRELDTYKDFRTHPLYCTRGKWNNELYGSKDITVLMKASRYSLNGIMREMYEMKKDNSDIKTMMVAFIGYIRSKKSWQHHYMGHLSACVYARHIKRMLSFYDEIIQDGNIIEMIATDSICWQGHAMPKITTKDKELGNFISEYENAKMVMLANGVYGIEVNGEIVCFKHQGTAANQIDVKIEKLQDIKKLKTAGIRAFDRSTNKFVEIDPILHRKRDI